MTKFEVNRKREENIRFQLKKDIHEDEYIDGFCLIINRNRMKKIHITPSLHT